MAWTYVREAFGRLYREERTRTTATRVFLVKSDIDVDIQCVVDADDGTTAIPEIGDEFDDCDSVSSGCYCVAREPEEIDKEQQIYRVVVEYETPNPNWGGTDPNPVDRPWQVVWQTQYVQIAAIETQCACISAAAWGGTGPAPDADIAEAKPIVNSAGDPFDPPIVLERPIHIVNLSKNYTRSYIDDNFASLRAFLAYKSTINDDFFDVAGYQCQTHEAKIDDIQITLDEESGIEFMRIDYAISCDPWLHDAVVLNQGWQEIFVDGTKDKIKTRPGGLELSAPGRLDLDGAAIRDEDEDSTFLGFGIYTEADFDNLNLPEELV